jgi:hypothetical protein
VGEQQGHQVGGLPDRGDAAGLGPILQERDLPELRLEALVRRLELQWQ